MLKNEINEVEIYLNNLIKIEEKSFDKNIKQFYDENKIHFILISFPSFYKEDFFLILKFLDYGIYYNDIEDTFGICKINNNQCLKYAEFFDDLSPTIQKFKDMILNKNLEEIINSEDVWT